MNHELYNRLHSYARELDVPLYLNDRPGNAMHIPDLPAPMPNGGYHPEYEHVVLSYDRTVPDAAIEVVAMHEFGHAATLERPQSARAIDQHAWEMTTGNIGPHTKRMECAAWEWAAGHISPESRPLAARMCESALRNYGVEARERERISRLIRSGAPCPAARPRR